jgi:hypothetical protein
MGIGGLAGSLFTKKKKKKIRRAQKAAYAAIAAEQQKLYQLDTLRADFGTRQEKLQQLREARIRREQILASAATSGALGSSSAVGGAGSVYSSAVGNVGVLNVFQEYSKAMGEAQSNIAKQEGELQRLGVKMEAQNAKAQMIGGITDAAIGIATLPWGGTAGAGIAFGKTLGITKG